MRILVVGDQHFRHELSYAPVISDGRRGEWDGVIQAIHKAAETVDAVVLLGDNLNSRHNHSSVIRRFVDFLNGFGDKEIHIIAGNHERYGHETALDFLKAVKGKKWHVYTTVTKGMVAGLPTWFLPYTTPAMMGVKTNAEAHDKLMEMFKDKAVLLFLHHGIKNSVLDGSSIDVDLFNEVSFGQQELEAHFESIFGGHVHVPQILSEQTVVAGNIFTTEVGEHSKSIWIKEPGKKVEEIKLPVRGIYKVVDDYSQDVFPQVQRIPNNSIVKYIVTDRRVPVEQVKEHLKRFDASILLEQYPSERTKVHFEEGMLDLSLDNLFKVYGQEKGVDYSELSQAYSIVDSYDFNRPRSVVSENGNSHP